LEKSSSLPPAPPSLFKNFSKNELCDRYFVKQNILFDPSLKFLKEWGFGGRKTFVGKFSFPRKSSLATARFFIFCRCQVYQKLASEKFFMGLFCFFSVLYFNILVSFILYKHYIWYYYLLFLF